MQDNGGDWVMSADHIRARGIEDNEICLGADFGDAEVVKAQGKTALSCNEEVQCLLYGHGVASWNFEVPDSFQVERLSKGLQLETALLDHARAVCEVTVDSDRCLVVDQMDIWIYVTLDLATQSWYSCRLLLLIHLASSI